MKRFPIVGTLRLTRRLWKIPANVAALGEAVGRVLPAPYLRALHLDTVDDVKAALRAAERFEAELRRRREAPAGGAAPLDKEKQAAQVKQVQEHYKQWKERRTQLSQRRINLQVLRRAALRRLQTGLEPKLRAAPGRRVPVEALSAGERIALANFVMGDGLSLMAGLLLRQMPEYVAHFDQVVLTGGLSKNPQDPEGKTRLSLFLGHRATGGYIRGQAGFTGLEYGK